MTKPVRVLIVDDSALMRTALKRTFASDPRLTVVGAAADAFEARDLILSQRPDVMTLDVILPKLDGVEFLRRLIPQYPLPTVVVSSITQEGGQKALEAFEAGAVDVVAKPDGSSVSMEHMLTELKEKVFQARKAKVRKPRARNAQGAAQNPRSVISSGGGATGRLIAIGASTGGTQALADLLERIPSNGPPIVITQHLPEAFTKSFVARLDRCCRAKVVVGAAGMSVQPGHVYVAPGDDHMTVTGRRGKWALALDRGPLYSGHRPSVDRLFQSVEKAAGGRAVGVLLTGMGEDGAEGLLGMRNAGAHTICQDEATCVVYGMPKAAVHRGAAIEILPLERITQAMLAAAQGKASAR